MHRRHRLRSSADFSRVMRSGRRTTGSGLVVYHLERDASEVPRVGLAVGRGIGKAVVRNRTRRRLREAVRPLLSAMAPCDVVVVARAGASDASGAELAGSVAAALSAAGLLLTGPSGRGGGTMGVQNPAPDVTEGTSS
jgi:ribonuclease P protein component